MDDDTMAADSFDLPAASALIRTAFAAGCAVLLAAAGGAWAQTPSTAPTAETTLTPPAERITDSAIFHDYRAYEALQGRIKGLNDRGRGAGPAVSDYHLSKAQCWLDVSFHEYTRNDRSLFPGEALHQSERLIEQMEQGVQPLPNDTPLVNGADRLRPDLWEEAARLRQHGGWRCAAQKVACAEVELVHAGNEHRQQGWRHASPYVQIAEDQLSAASAAAIACVPPPVAPAPVPVPAPQPCPVCPTAAAPAPVQLSAHVLFDFDRHTENHIRAKSRQELKTLIERLQQGDLSLQSIRLSGHADRLNSTGDNQYNVRLAQRRARTVEQILQRAGIPAALIAVESHGDSEQVIDCRQQFTKQAELQECLLANRRVQVDVTATPR